MVSTGQAHALREVCMVSTGQAHALREVCMVTCTQGSPQVKHMHSGRCAWSPQVKQEDFFFADMKCHIMIMRTCGHS